jgi:hypothetical protein
MRRLKRPSWSWDEERPTAQHRLAADGGWRNREPPRLKPNVRQTGRGNYC